MTRSQKGFAHILPLLLVLILVGIGGWWMWKNDKLNITVESPTLTSTLSLPTPDPMADWESYTNEKYSFTFRYKSIDGLELRSCGNTPDDYEGVEHVVLIEIPNSYNLCAPHDGYADIDIYVDQGDKTNIESIQQEFPTGVWALDVEPFNIGGVQAIFIESRPLGEIDELGTDFIPSDIKHVRIFKNGYTYLLYLGNENYSETFDQILSTFGFVD